jgi:peptidoglycan/LPS O-acetylase OafA/YrhL
MPTETYFSATPRTITQSARPAPAPSYPRLIDPRYRALDLWRGLACLFVVLYHASVWANIDNAPAERLHHPIAAWMLESFDRLQVGVPMFFVISGYCIAATSDSSRRKTRAVTLDYFKRRIRRIYPPFWAVVAATMAIAFILVWAGHPAFLTMPKNQLAPPQSLTASQWLGNLTLTETWRPHIFGPPKTMWLNPAWTLCYEEQFYIVCGLLLFAPRRFFTGIAVVSAITVLTLTSSILTSRVQISGFFFDGYWLSFAAGVAVYYHLNYARPGGNASASIRMGIALLLVAIVRYVFLRHSNNERLRFELYNLLLAGLFAIALLHLRPFDQRLSSSAILRPLTSCGRMCYSLYLIHWPVTILVGHALYSAGVRGFLPVLTIMIPALTAASIAAAALFYFLVERHFLNSPPRRAGESNCARVPISQSNSSVCI